MIEVGVALERAPQALAMQPDPETFQETPRLLASFCTVALNWNAPFGATVAVAGLTATAIGGGRTPAVLAGLKAAKAAPQAADEVRLAFAIADPVAGCRASST